jgi:hypothetical protein
VQRTHATWALQDEVVLAETSKSQLPVSEGHNNCFIRSAGDGSVKKSCAKWARVLALELVNCWNCRLTGVIKETSTLGFRLPGRAHFSSPAPRIQIVCEMRFTTVTQDRAWAYHKTPLFVN